MKKIIYSLLMICIIFISTGCGNKTIDKSLSSIMKEVYKGIDKDEIPALENVKEGEGMQCNSVSDRRVL